MNLETKITIYKFTPQVFTLTPYRLCRIGEILILVSDYISLYL